MSLPDPPRPPAGHPADAAEYAEYLRRYDRYLDLYERELDQAAEQNREYAESVRTQAQGYAVYERWVGFQRQGLMWGAAGAVVLAVAGMAWLLRLWG